MDRVDLLRTFDREMRQRPTTGPGETVEDLGSVVRVIGDQGCVTYSRLDAAHADEAIAREVAYFQGIGRTFEWKVYGHDPPADLADRLRTAGYRPDPPETLEVLDLTQALPVPPPPAALEIRRIATEADLRLAVSVSEDAFGTGEGWAGPGLAHLLSSATNSGYLALWDGQVVACGRMELPPARSFASLWGGGTAPAARGRGIYPQLVAARARIARDRGYRYLTVDARETSRPILERLGFTPLDTMQGWVRTPSTGA